MVSDKGSLPTIADKTSVVEGTRKGEMPSEAPVAFVLRATRLF